MGLFRELMRAIKAPDSEIRNHAAIAGTVTGTLAAIHHLEAEGLGALPSLWALALFVGLFAFGYFLMVLIEVVWVRKPIPIKDVGMVDGYWIYATRDVDDIDFNGGSTLCIKSMGYGFTIEGFSWELVPVAFGGRDGELNEKGHFHATGVEWTEGRLHYSYRGMEAGEEDTGVGFYAFTRNPNGLSVDGRFTGSRLGPNLKTRTRRLEGRRIYPKGDWQIEKACENAIHARLRDALREELQRLSAGSRLSFHFDHAGRVDGKWVDGIFEDQAGRWTLIEGSLIQIESSSESKRFRVTGWTFKWDDLKRAGDLTRVQKDFYFTGVGQPLEHSDGFYYNYVGFAGEQATGIGYYNFAPKESSSDGATTFTGAFLRRLRDPVRIVYGQRVEPADCDDLGWKTQLRAYLSALETRSPL